MANANVAPSPPVEPEDFRDFTPTVTVGAPGISGSELFVTFRAAPGSAAGLTFQLGGLGNAILRQAALIETTVETFASGAAGGTIRIVEDSDLGVCQRDVVTTPGMTPAEIAAAISSAFGSVSDPGPEDCLAMADPLDVRAQGPSFFTVLPRGINVTSLDPGVGFSMAPAPIVVANRPPDCSHVRAVPATLGPPNHKLDPVSLEGATDPDGDVVTTKVTRVRQDENPAGEVDAMLSGATLLLRSERDGSGDGRVYHVSFTVTDALGASCDGEVTVCVPHDVALSSSSSKPTCGDQGPLYASGIP
jgi:hypothetical protein